MYRNAVAYGGTWLAPGSRAMELYDEWKKRPNFSGTKQHPAGKILLDAHLAEVDKAWRKLEGR